MRCSICGLEIPEGAKGCPNCVSVVKESGNFLPAFRREENLKKKWVPWAWGLGLSIFVIWVIKLFLDFVDELLRQSYTGR